MSELTASQILSFIKTNQDLQNIGFDAATKDSDITVEEIGDGNINDILKVTLVKNTEVKAVVKHGLPFIKCIGPEFPLSTDRVQVEYRSLCRYHSICNNSVPTPYCYDDELHSIAMECLDDHQCMKTQLISGKVDKVAVQRLAENMGKFQTVTHVTNLSESEFEVLKTEFKNEAMVQLHNNIVFIDPYQKDNPLNKVKPEVLKRAEQVYSDQNLQAAVDALRIKFLQSKECLLHGDLHTGSVMVKDGQPKIFDNEFAFVGPAGYDLGHLVAHFIFTYHQHMLTEENNPSHRQVAYKAMEACKIIGKSFEEFFEPRVPDRKQYSGDLWCDVAGYAGCELVRRVLGVAHVPDINHSGAMELEALESGLRLLRGQGQIRSMDKLLFIGLALC